jgi:hypothetical protein
MEVTMGNDGAAIIAQCFKKDLMIGTTKKREQMEHKPQVYPFKASKRQKDVLISTLQSLLPPLPNSCPAAPLIFEGRLLSQPDCYGPGTC